MEHPEHKEKLQHLLTDPAHWQFELITKLVFDAVLFLILYPLVRIAVNEHDKKKHAV